MIRVLKASGPDVTRVSFSAVQDDHPTDLAVSFSLPSKALFCDLPPAPFQSVETKELCKGPEGLRP